MNNEMNSEAKTVFVDANIEDVIWMIAARAIQILNLNPEALGNAVEKAANEFAEEVMKEDWQSGAAQISHSHLINKVYGSILGNSEFGWVCGEDSPIQAWEFRGYVPYRVTPDNGLTFLEELKLFQNDEPIPEGKGGANG